MIIIQSISIPDLNPPNATMTLEYFPYESKINVCSPRIQENDIGHDMQVVPVKYLCSCEIFILVPG